MYVPEDFRCNNEELISTIVEKFPLALAIVPGVDEAYPIPVIRENNYFLGHLSKRNSLVKALGEAGSAHLIFLGPNAYISPNWYEDPSTSVPTWNYCVADFLCHVNPFTHKDEIISVIETQVQRHDPQWRINQLSQDLLDEMLEEITAFRFDIVSVQSKIKMSQNRSKNEQEQVIHHLKSQPTSVSVGDVMAKLYGL